MRGTRAFYIQLLLFLLNEIFNRLSTRTQKKKCIGGSRNCLKKNHLIFNKHKQRTSTRQQLLRKKEEKIYQLEFHRAQYNTLFLRIHTECQARDKVTKFFFAS